MEGYKFYPRGRERFFGIKVAPISFNFSFLLFSVPFSFVKSAVLLCSELTIMLKLIYEDGMVFVFVIAGPLFISLAGSMSFSLTTEQAVC